ncbi:MAG TPA: hypothetical protein VFY84_00165 [Jiangellales bacterium]|nr:hypothetical protein [Jiangellales bacterium]
MRFDDELRADIRDHYDSGQEDERLRQGRGRLELLRTQDVLRRWLPTPPAKVLDVGGASGVHAEWLATDGYDVELIDPVPLRCCSSGRCITCRTVPSGARHSPRPPVSYGREASSPSQR